MDFPPDLTSLYEPGPVLGQGGMGVVFRATSLRTGDAVALKILDPNLASDDTLRDRFQQEARLASRVKGHHVVAILHSGEGTGGSLYIAYELVEGESLRDLMKREGPLSWDRAGPLTRALLKGLRSIHKAGIVHRDLKPTNVLIDRSGVLKIIDLGIARDTADRLRRTQTGEILGTPWYSCPEQIDGRDVTAASDLYTLGTIVYEMLAGQPPFNATPLVALLHAHMAETPRPLEERVPNVPPHVRSAVMRLLAKNPADRYQDAREVLDDLGRRTVTMALSTDVTSTRVKVTAGSRRRPGRGAGPAALALLGVGVGAGIWSLAPAGDPAGPGSGPAVDPAVIERVVVGLGTQLAVGSGTEGWTERARSLLALMERPGGEAVWMLAGLAGPSWTVLEACLARSGDPGAAFRRECAAALGRTEARDGAHAAYWWLRYLAGRGTLGDGAEVWLVLRAYRRAVRERGGDPLVASRAASALALRLDGSAGPPGDGSGPAIRRRLWALLVAREAARHGSSGSPASDTLAHLLERYRVEAAPGPAGTGGGAGAGAPGRARLLGLVRLQVHRDRLEKARSQRRVLDAEREALQALELAERGPPGPERDLVLGQLYLELATLAEGIGMASMSATGEPLTVPDPGMYLDLAAFPLKRGLDRTDRPGAGDLPVRFRLARARLGTLLMDLDEAQSALTKASEGLDRLEGGSGFARAALLAEKLEIERNLAGLRSRLGGSR